MLREHHFQPGPFPFSSDLIAESPIHWFRTQSKTNQKAFRTKHNTLAFTTEIRTPGRDILIIKTERKTGDCRQ
jgi:hypothetical protein